MLQAYIPDATPLQCDDYYIRELPTGQDELIFSLSIWADEYRAIEEETLIEDREPEGVTKYRVKAIDGGDKTAQIKALLDLDDWRGTVRVNYAVSGTIADNVRAVAPTGWTVVDRSGMTGTASTELNGGSPLDLLEEFRKIYDGASYRFNQETKTVTIWDLYNGPNLGTFMTRELNLHDVQYKGKSTQFVTRLYAYGKDGLSIAEANGGIPYVENHTYSDRVICAYWQDTRYEIASNLKEAAIAHLAEIAVPERSYTCSVADLAAIDPERYSYLSFELFSQVGLIDETRSATKIMHRVCERWRYPNYPEKNNVILSNAPRRIQVQVVEALRGPINGNRLETGSIGSGKLGGGSVLESKIAPLAVTTGKLAESAVTVNKIRNGAVVEEKIATDAVTNTKIMNKAISRLKCDDEIDALFEDLIYVRDLFAEFASVGAGDVHVLTCDLLYIDGYKIRPYRHEIIDHNTTYGLSDNSYTDWTSRTEEHRHQYTHGAYSLNSGDGNTRIYINSVLSEMIT